MRPGTCRAARVVEELLEVVGHGTPLVESGGEAGLDDAKPTWNGGDVFDRSAIAQLNGGLLRATPPRVNHSGGDVLNIPSAKEAGKKGSIRAGAQKGFGGPSLAVQLASALAVVALLSGCGRSLVFDFAGTSAGASTSSGGSSGGGSSGSTGSSSGDVAETWVDRTAGAAASGLRWVDVASDSTGEYLVAIAAPTYSGNSTLGGDIWTSTDYGVTWSNRTGGTAASGQPWGFVASDASGAHLVAVQDADVPGDIWTSSDSGATWINRTAGTEASGQLWNGIASDSTGANLAATTFGQGIWTSTSSDATWTGGGAPDLLWGRIASDATGSHLAAVVVEGGDVWTSANSGTTWTDRATMTSISQDYAFVASDSTGAHLVVAVNAGDIWTSATSGATWTNQMEGTAASGKYWAGVASDTSGTHLVAVSAGAGDIWVSSNAGGTWGNQTAGTSASGQNWAAVASDSTGAHLVAVVFEGDIWTN